MQLSRQLRQFLRARGPCDGRELRQALAISQPSFSRLTRKMADVLSVGPRSARQYALIREISGVDTPIPVYDLGPRTPARLGSLTPIHPSGFWYEAGAAGQFYPDLPWFFQDLRPAGYLGRLVPRQHADLELPPDIRLWNDRATLTYLTRRASDPIGALILGDEAFQAFLEQVSHPASPVPRAKRSVRYPAIALDVLEQSPVGSSAGGEQSKFLTQRGDGHAVVPVLVKFSPPRNSEAAVRTADLLIAEHVALEVLRSRGRQAAATELLIAEGRVFLEVERFDRVDGRRIGQISLAAVDAEFTGLLTDWSTTASALHMQGAIQESDCTEIRHRDLYGKLIANSDRHLGNISFRLDGTQLAGVAPTYDMLPMHYRQVQGEVIDRPWRPAMLSPADADIATDAWEAAVGFWSATSEHPEISAGFRAIATENLRQVEALAVALAKLPTR